MQVPAMVIRDEPGRSPAIDRHGDCGVLDNGIPPAPATTALLEVDAAWRDVPGHRRVACRTDPGARAALTPRRATCARARGFTRLDMVISVTIATLLLLGFHSLAATGRDRSTRTHAWMDVDDELVRLQRQIVEELQGASIVGEDINGNLTIDAGEDGNGNGRLDSDWRVTADSITFNRVLADGKLTLPITYRLSGSDIERIVMTSTTGSRSRALVARGAMAFAIAQNGNTVALTARFQQRTPGGETIERQRTFDVRARN